jgi:hypothetical protein
MAINPPYNSFISFALDAYDHSIQGNPFFSSAKRSASKKKGAHV